MGSSCEMAWTSELVAVGQVDRSMQSGKRVAMCVAHCCNVFCIRTSGFDDLVRLWLQARSNALLKPFCIFTAGPCFRGLNLIPCWFIFAVARSAAR